VRPYLQLIALLCRLQVTRMILRCGSPMVLGLRPVLLAVALVTHAPFAEAATTVRVSVATDGSPGNDVSRSPSLDASGTLVAFSSGSSNLVPGDTNFTSDIFVHDFLTGTTERVSVASDGTQANARSREPTISACGRFVAFSSEASNLVQGDSLSVAHVFAHDRVLGTTDRISVGSDGTAANSHSGNAAISGDGRFVAFDSVATNLVPSPLSWVGHVYVHDRDTGVTERVSVASDGTEGDRRSRNPTISTDGRFVAFTSDARNLVDDDANGRPDVFVHDRLSGVTERVTVLSGGAEAALGGVGGGISGDGRYVAFQSRSPDLALQTAAFQQVFVHDRETGTTAIVSETPNLTPATGDSYTAAISVDGRFIAFASEADDLVSSDTNQESDIFLRDTALRMSEIVSVATDGTESNGWSGNAAIGFDGRYVAFESFGTNLVAGDQGGVHIFLRDRGENESGPRPEVEAIAKLFDYLEGLQLPRGVARSLEAKLEATLRALDRGHGSSECHHLRAFSSQLEAVAAVHVTLAEAEAMRMRVSEINALLMCR
jgi:Tol biopolymer transport system component